MSLDPKDRQLLALLQADGRMTNAALAEAINLSPTATLARVQRLFREGYVRAVTAQLDPRRIGLGTLLFVEVLLDRTTPNVIEAFNAAVQTHDEIVECHLVAGGFDYLLKVRAHDMDDFHRFVSSRLWTLPGVRETRTYAVMQEVKASTRLPIRAR
jgi:Lrp/AsnC family leucine-responsive transcriptional regulator